MKEWKESGKLGMEVGKTYTFSVYLSSFRKFPLTTSKSDKVADSLLGLDSRSHTI